MPRCLILAGPNGAGKTTTARLLLPAHLNTIEFVNADYIAAGLSPFNPESVALQAGRLLLARLKELSSAGVDFALETTLATRIYAPLMQEWRQLGYETTLLYLYLPAPEQCLERVAQRVAAGGHNIPPGVIRRRYALSLKYLFGLYQNQADFWAVFDNEHGTARPVADSHHIHDNALWQTIRQQSLTA
jgi:predicted ABC-type ATPase